MFTKLFKRKLSSKAQAMVEFALVLPILMVIIIGVFEAGRLLFYYVAVNTASRDAARYGATVGTNGGVPHYYDCATITQIAQSRGFIATINNVAIEYDRGPLANGVNPATIGACAAQPELGDGDRIVVTASAQFTPIIKELGGIRIFNDITVRSTSYRTIMSRTYLPQQVSYESSTSSGTSSSGTSSSGTSSSSTSSGLRVCSFEIINPDKNTNLSIVDATWKFRNKETNLPVSVTSITIISGDPANPNQPARIKEVYVGGTLKFGPNPSGVLTTTVTGPWTVSPGQDLNIRIVYTNGIRIKNVTINPVIDAQPTCKYPFP